MFTIFERKMLICRFLISWPQIKRAPWYPYVISLIVSGCQAMLTSADSRRFTPKSPSIVGILGIGCR